jgi:plasmid stabilization system protein ParE
VKLVPVVWAESARDDLDELLSYFAADAPGAALDVLDRIEARAAELERFSNRGRIVPELHWHGIVAYRELIEPPWRVVYRADRASVVVLAVIDARRRLDAALLSRLLRR